jgi:hypothetical protein
MTTRVWDEDEGRQEGCEQCGALSVNKRGFCSVRCEANFVGDFDNDLGLDRYDRTEDT